MSGSKGCTSWKGKDKRNGRTAFMTIWQFEETQIEKKCPISCEYTGKPIECEGHKSTLVPLYYVVLKDLIERARYLINNVKHRNLVQYLALNIYAYVEDDDHPIRYKIKVAQEFIEGESIQSICEKGQSVNVSAIGKEIMESITYFQNKSTEITHGYLNEKSIFLDKNGVCRVADYDLIPYLMYLNGMYSMHIGSDLKALGNVIARLRDITFKSTNDFIDQCHSGRVIFYSDLLKHPFLSNIRCCNKKPQNNGQSITNFIIEEELGRGSFGVVLKAKQQADEKSYAIKLVKMPRSKNEYEKVEREAELISRIKHKNVVRYITSWKQEKVNLAEFEERYGFCFDDDESMVSGTSEYEFCV